MNINISRLNVLFTAVGLLLCGNGPAYAGDTPNIHARDIVVRVEGGRVAGVLSATTGVRIFKGIPYAAPPTGNLRWSPPQPVVPWSGVRAASQFSASCKQPVLRRTDIMSETQVQPSSEDCLYLNVWTPARSAKERRPVLLWIYPGAPFYGEASSPSYDGEALSKKGVVVVTINYRLGIFGTLAHPELSRESPRHVSGNYALLDMLAAIKWTRRNISAFGGDPTRVTLYGESRGGRAVSALSVSPLVRGDICGVIAGDTIYSGSSKLVDAERSGAEFTKAAGASIGDLRSMLADELMAAASKYQFRQFEFVDDGWALTGDVFAGEKSGARHDIPILTGITANFSSPFLVPIPAKEFREAARKEFGTLADRFLALYPASSDTEAAESQRSEVTDSTAWIHTEWAAEDHHG